VTRDNQEAKMEVAQQVPFLTGQYSTTNGTGQAFQTIQQEDVGTLMTVTPTISAGNVVLLKLDVESSSISSSASGVGGNPITNKNTISTSVLIKDGGTLKDATLDYCGKTFVSDKLRLARNQTLLSSRTTSVSNEIAAYSEGGTAQAYHELQAAVRSCDGSTVSQDGSTYRVSVESLPTNPGWGPTAFALRTTIANLTHPADSYADYTVYIIDGDLLAAIYGGAGSVTQDLVFQVADLSAQRLHEAINDQPPTKASIPVPAGATLTDPSAGASGAGSSI